MDGMLSWERLCKNWTRGKAFVKISAFRSEDGTCTSVKIFDLICLLYIMVFDVDIFCALSGATG
jgi:hypothetical protein